eukprot:jgi/Mesvir1/5571/Mv25569-RA.2
MGCGISSHRQTVEGAGRAPEPQRHGPPTHRTGQQPPHAQPQRPPQPRQPDARATTTGAVPSSRPPPLAVREGSPVPSFPDQPTPSKKRVEISMTDPVSCFFRGNELLESGHYLEAIEAFSQAIAKRQDFARAYHGRGLAHLKNSEPALSIEDFTEAIRLQPGDEAYLCDRASAYTANGEHEMAIKDCNAALAINPASAEAFNARGVAHKHLGNVDKAVEDWEEAAQLEPRNICVICMENKRGVRSHPCLHSVMCASCAKEIEQKKMPCPVCSTPITKLEYGSFATTFSSEELTKALRALPPLSPLGASPLGMSPLGQGHSHGGREEADTADHDGDADVEEDGVGGGGDDAAANEGEGESWPEGEGEGHRGRAARGGAGGGGDSYRRDREDANEGAAAEGGAADAHGRAHGEARHGSPGGGAGAREPPSSRVSRDGDEGSSAGAADASLSFAGLHHSRSVASNRSSDDGSGYPSASISFAVPRGHSPGGEVEGLDAASASFSLAPRTGPGGGGRAPWEGPKSTLLPAAAVARAVERVSRGRPWGGFKRMQTRRVQNLTVLERRWPHWRQSAWGAHLG